MTSPDVKYNKKEHSFRVVCRQGSKLWSPVKHRLVLLPFNRTVTDPYPDFSWFCPTQVFETAKDVSVIISNSFELGRIAHAQVLSFGTRVLLSWLQSFADQKFVRLRLHYAIQAVAPYLQKRRDGLKVSTIPTTANSMHWSSGRAVE